MNKEGRLVQDRQPLAETKTGAQWQVAILKKYSKQAGVPLAEWALTLLPRESASLSCCPAKITNKTSNLATLGTWS